MTPRTIRSVIHYNAGLCMDALVLEQVCLFQGDLHGAAAMADSAQQASERAFYWSKRLLETPA